MICYVTTGAALVGEQSFYAEELDNGGVLIRLADLNKAAKDVDYSMKIKVHLKKMFARKRMIESANGASPTVKAKDKERDSLLDLDIGTLYLAMLKVMLQHNTQRRRRLRNSIHKSQS